MNKKIAILLIISTLLFPLLIPSVSALTWANRLVTKDETPTDNTSITEDDIQLEAAGNKTHAFFTGYAPNDGIFHKSSTNNGVTWSNFHIVVSGTAITGTSPRFDFTLLDANNIFGCYMDGGNVFFCW